MRADVNKEQKHCCKHVYRCCTILTQGSAGADSLLPLLDVRGTAVLLLGLHDWSWHQHLKTTAELTSSDSEPLSSDVDWSAACMSKNEEDVCLSTGQRPDNLTVRLESVHEENRVWHLNPVIIYFLSFFTENSATILHADDQIWKLQQQIRSKGNLIGLFFSISIWRKHCSLISCCQCADAESVVFPFYQNILARCTVSSPIISHTV